MKEGFFHGNTDHNRNDGDAPFKPHSSSFGPQEEQQQIIFLNEISEPSEFNLSNRRLDNYHLTFSSWL